MSLRGVIAALATGTYTVTRRAAHSYDADGLLVLGAASTFSIVASVQPVTGRNTVAVPEGYRGEEQRVIFTTTELRGLGDSTAAPAPDTIALGGETWTIVHTEAWYGLSGAPHWRAYAARSAAP